jgi:hypothetical protein
VFSGEATNTNFVVLDLTREEFEPTIYRTRGEHANHYTTDAVNFGIVGAKEQSFTHPNSQSLEYYRNIITRQKASASSKK